MSNKLYSMLVKHPKYLFYQKLTSLAPKAENSILSSYSVWKYTSFRGTFQRKIYFQCVDQKSLFLLFCVCVCVVPFFQSFNQPSVSK